MSNYSIVPNAALTATVDAIRTKSGSQATIEFDHNTGFKDAVDAIPGDGITFDDIAFGNIAGDVYISSSGTIVPYAFAENQGITSVSAPNVTRVNERAFSNCRGITSISLPLCTNIGNNAFYYCSSMKSITLPDSDITLGQSAFYNCWALENVDFSKINTIPASCFRGCWPKGCSFNPVTVNDSGFRDAKYFGVEYFPRLTTINGTYTFAGAYDTSNFCTVDCFVAPALTTMASSQVLSYCNCLVKIDIGNLIKIQNETFRTDPNFNVLILRKSGVTELNNINAFMDTPFASGKAGGTLYVPQSQIAQYEQATNWSTILGYANNSIVAIEGSQYENYYADGTPIPTT